MGICCELITATDDMIDRVQAEPALIWRLYAPDEPEFYLEEIGAGRKPGWLARLFGAVETPVPDPLPAFDFAAGQRFQIDLDKAWDGIDFCLKRVLGEEATSLFSDGEAIGAVEIGYGPAFSFRSREVLALAAAVSDVSADRVLDARDPAAMAKLYPEGLWARDDDDTHDYLRENFNSLKSFLAQASAQQLGVIVAFS